MDEPVGRYLEAYDWPPDHGFALADMRCTLDFLGDEEAWIQFMALAGAFKLLEDERFNSIEHLQSSGTKLLLPSLLEEFTSNMQYADVEKFVRSKPRGVIAPVLDLQTLMQHPQFKALGISDDSADHLGMRFPFDSTPSITRDAAAASHLPADPETLPVATR